MNFHELNESEQHLLGALVRLMVRADGDFHPAEEFAIRQLGRDLTQASATPDPEALWRLVTRSAQRYPDERAVHADLVRATRPEARPLVLSILAALASIDTLHGAERSLLAVLRLAWDLREPTT